VTPPEGYVIGVDDVLSIIFWRDKDLTTDAVVRPDGKISLPLLNDVAVAGLTPEQARDRILERARTFIEEPSATIVVKQINSLKVFITGQVAKPGAYPLTSRMTVMQLIALAGGLEEYASGKNILVMRTERGRPIAYRFNYQEVLDRRNLPQNIELRPGDTIVVP
jgi:polysaccharide export outer membrane protein